MAATTLTPSIAAQLTRIVTDLLQLKDRRLDEILEWFEKRVAGVSKSILLRLLTQYYYLKQLKGPDKIAERIILHYSIFCINEFKILNNNYNFARPVQEINPSVAVLLKCYNDEYRKNDPYFATITGAEKQFIGRLLGYTYEQRRLLLLDETPEKLANVPDDDPFNCYVASLLKRSGTATIVRDVFEEMGLAANVASGTPSTSSTMCLGAEYNAATSVTSANIGAASEQNVPNNIPSNTSSSSSRSLQLDSLEINFTEQINPHHFGSRTDSGVHDCEAINIENALDELFHGSIKALKHDELESLKNFFEKNNSLGILKTYEITMEKMIECVIAFPKMMGSALTFMLASNDERVYAYLNHMIHESFSAATMIAMVQMFVESFKRGLQLDPKFVDNTLTCCLNFLESAAKVTKSDESRIVTLVIHYIHNVVIYMPDAVSHRFGEILNIISKYNFIRPAPIIYNKILQHQRKQSEASPRKFM